MNYKENCHVSIDIPFMPEKPLIRFCIYKSNENSVFELVFVDDFRCS